MLEPAADNSTAFKEHLTRGFVWALIALPPRVPWENVHVALLSMGLRQPNGVLALPPTLLCLPRLSDNKKQPS